MICSECMQTIDDGTDFCPYCGENIGQKRNNTAALVRGIVGISCSLLGCAIINGILVIAGFVLGIIAVVLGAKGLKTKKYSVVGIVLGIIAIICSVLMLYIMVIVLFAFL